MMTKEQIEESKREMFKSVDSALRKFARDTGKAVIDIECDINTATYQTGSPANITFCNFKAYTERLTEI